MSLNRLIGIGLIVYGAFTGNPGAIQQGYFVLFSGEYQAKRARQQRRRAIAAYNASLQDRLEMVDVSADQARTIALGRVRAVEGVRRRWTSGANEQRLTMIVSLAGHQIDAVEQVYFDDVPLTLDGSGYVLTEPYRKTRTESATASITVIGGVGATTLPHTPTFVAAAAITGSLETTQFSVATIVAGANVSIVGAPADGVYTVEYQYTAGTNTARVRTYLGTAAQNVGSDLAAEYPGKISATDRFAGIALLVVDIDYDPDVYPQGRPNVTALFRGARVYDPRLDSTVPGGSGAHRVDNPATWAWSENPALLAYHYARHANGWALPVASCMPREQVMVEAATCDTSTNFTLRKPDNSTQVVTLPRYRAGIVVSTDGDPRAAMDELMESMAGRDGWAGGVWRFRCGRMPSSVFTMDQGWLFNRMQDDGTPEQGPSIQFDNGVAREEKVNIVSGSCVDPVQRWQILPFPRRADDVLVAAEGPYPLEVEYQAVNHVAHAQHLASVTIRRAQAALRVQASCGLQAYRCELFDVGTVTLPAYGISGKTFEVTGWRWHPAEGVQLRLAEITQAIYDPVAELRGRDPAPNTDLPRPWEVEALTGLAVTSGTPALTDGSVLVRARVQWTAAVSQNVRAGGRVEVQYREVGATNWLEWAEDGRNTSTVIPALRARGWYVFRGRFRSAPPLGVAGNWGAEVVHQVASKRAARVFRQTAAPTGDVADGDQWFDTDDGNRHYVRDGGSWVSVRDAGIATALSDAATAIANAATAQGTADGKVKTFVGSSPPTASGVGDLWVHTGDANKLYRWSGSAWVLIRDNGIAQALTDASQAQATADGKVVTFVQASAPTAEGVGDLWIDSDDGNKVSRWSGSAWVALPIGTGAIAPGAATEVFGAFDAGPRTATNNAAPVNVVAAAACQIIVTVTVNAECVNSTGSAKYRNAIVSVYGYGDSLGGGTAYDSRFISRNIANGETQRESYSASYTFTGIAAGADNTFSASVTGTTGATIDTEFTDIRVRVEVIYR